MSRNLRWVEYSTFAGPEKVLRTNDEIQAKKSDGDAELSYTLYPLNVEDGIKLISELKTQQLLQLWSMPYYTIPRRNRMI